MILICRLLKYDINKVIRRREHSTMKTVLVILITFRWLRRNWRLSSHLYICNNDVTSSERLILIKQVNWSQTLMKTFKENSSSIKLQMIGVIFSLQHKQHNWSFHVCFQNVWIIYNYFTQTPLEEKTETKIHKRGQTDWTLTSNTNLMLVH